MRSTPRNWPGASAASDAFRVPGEDTKDPVKGLCFAAPSVYIGNAFENRSFTHVTGSRLAPAGRDEKGTPVPPWRTPKCSARLDDCASVHRHGQSGAVPATVNRTTDARWRRFATARPSDPDGHRRGRLSWREGEPPSVSVDHGLPIAWDGPWVRRARRPACVRDENPDRHRGFSHRQQPPGPEACGVPAPIMAPFLRASHPWRTPVLPRPSLL